MEGIIVTETGFSISTEDGLLLITENYVESTTSTGGINWTKPYEKPDTHAEIRAIVERLANGTEEAAEPEELTAIVEHVERQIEQLPLPPAIDVQSLIAQVTAAVAEYQDRMDEDDAETLLMGHL